MDSALVMDDSVDQNATLLEFRDEEDGLIAHDGIVGLNPQVCFRRADLDCPALHLAIVPFDVAHA